jgi:hypothetical protein
MSSKFILPQLIRKRKGTFNEVLMKLHSLEFTHPDINTGELAEALNNAGFARQAAQALIDKGECPIYFDKCGICQFYERHQCKYNEVK